MVLVTRLESKEGSSIMPKHKMFFAVSIDQDSSSFLAQYDKEERSFTFRSTLIDGWPVAVVGSEPISPDLKQLLAHSTLAEIKKAIAYNKPCMGGSEFAFRIRKVKMA